VQPTLTAVAHERPRRGTTPRGERMLDAICWALFWHGPLSHLWKRLPRCLTSRVDDAAYAHEGAVFAVLVKEYEQAPCCEDCPPPPGRLRWYIEDGWTTDQL
jgi:hypothetical protein